MVGCKGVGGWVGKGGGWLQMLTSVYNKADADDNDMYTVIGIAQLSLSAVLNMSFLHVQHSPFPNPLVSP